MASRKYFETISKEIFTDQKEYIYFSMHKFGLSEPDAKDLFCETGLKIIQNLKEIPADMTLKNYVKRRMRWTFLDDLKKNKRAQSVLSQSKYNYTDKDDEFTEVEPKETKNYLDIKENSIKADINDKSIIFITTKKPHKIIVGTAIFLSGLKDLSDRTKDRLRNKWGDAILVDQVINEFTFSIKVWFNHEIDHLGYGGDTAKINFKAKLPVLKNENLSKRLSKNTQEERAALNIQIKKCMDKIKGKDREILKLSLIPDKKINNNQKPTTNRIAEILNMAPGTVGEIAIRVREAFALCIKSNEMVNV